MRRSVPVLEPTVARNRPRQEVQFESLLQDFGFELGEQ
jgi:hypothetical protein